MQPDDVNNVRRQRLGSIMMLHDRGERRTDFRPLRLTVAHRAFCQGQACGIGERLIAARVDGDLSGAIDDLAARLR